MDLTYLSPRIVVHGFPAVGLEHIYRNPRGEIRRFMDEHHKDHYKVYNFCCEPGRGYEPDDFYGRVERYPFKDHNTSPLRTMVAFANSVKAWLDADPQNVVNMHCKAGKGRAGLMSCVALVRTGVVQSATEALDLYDKTRVTNNRGLTVTSQRKYVIFYETLWRKFWNVSGNIGDIPAEPAGEPTKWIVPPEPEFHLLGVEVLRGNADVIKNITVRVFKGTNFNPELVYTSAAAADADEKYFETDCFVQGNFKVLIMHKPSAFKKAVRVFEFWHNTLFMEKNAAYIDFGLDQIDIKRKLVKKFGETITLRLYFTKKVQGRAGDVELVAVGNNSV